MVLDFVANIRQNAQMQPHPKTFMNFIKRSNTRMENPKGKKQRSDKQKMIAGQEVSLDHIRQLHARLYEFYKTDVMTDVTITCASNPTPLRAHAFVCATSGHLAELLAAGAASGPPYALALPSMNAERFRILLDFLYSMSLDPAVPITTYLELARELKVPLLPEACQQVLNQKIQAFGFKLDSAEAGAAMEELRAAYLFILTTFSEEGKLREQMINLFAAHPFAFMSGTCLRLIPPDVFVRLLKEGCLLMCDTNGVVSLGRRYGEQCSRLLEVYAEAHELAVSPLQASLQSLLDRAAKRPAPVSACPLLSPGARMFISRQNFGCHNRALCTVLSDKIATHKDFLPHTWKICGLRSYAARSWEGLRPFAGFDVIYENIWTGETQECLWNTTHQRTSYIVQDFQVPPGDVIEGVHIRHGWLIDQITFVTRGGVHLGPCGLSMGGNVSELSMKDSTCFSPYTAEPSPRTSRTWRNRIAYDAAPVDNGDNGDSESSSSTLSSQDPAPALVALHGFEYVKISNQGMVFWNNVRFCYSALDFDAVKRKMPISPSPDVLASLHYTL